MDIANMVLFLCSEKAGFITGENICQEKILSIREILLLLNVQISKVSKINYRDRY